jgi:dynein heavy chain
VFESYKELYTLEREQVLAAFESNAPHLSEFESEMEYYERLEIEIAQLPTQQSLTAAIQLSSGMNVTVGSILCYLRILFYHKEPLKLALVVEARAWKTAYGHSLNSHYRTSMNNIVQFLSEYSKRLSRPIEVHSTG